MFDIFITNERNPVLYIGIFLFYLIVILFNNRRVKKVLNHRNYDFDWKLIFLCCLFVCVFHFVDGDFYTYQDEVHHYRYGDDYIIEPFYYWLIPFIGNNYLIFRIIVWGISLLAFYQASQRFSIGKWFPLYLIFVTNINTFAYARATLAMSVYFWGISLILSPYRKKNISWGAGIALIYLSTKFHTSAWLLVALALTVLIPLNKFIIVCVALLLPISLGLMSSIIDSLLLGGIIEDERVLKKLGRYSDIDNDFGIARKLVGAFRFLLYYVETIVVTYILFWKTKTDIPYKEKGLYSVTLSIVAVATTFFFMGDAFETLFYRVLNMAMIPLTILVCMLYKQKLLGKKAFIFIVLLGFNAQLIKFLYTIYLSLL